MKKLVSAVVASAIAASTLVPVFAATFKDVNEKNYEWAYSYVEDMAERGLISGYPDGTFRPGNAVSRMEAFALFARLIGSNSDENADIVAVAKEKYADVLEDYKLSYAEGDVAFMLMRGIITEAELDTYFKGDKKSEPMPRYEAAILITKAMLGEAEAKNEVLIDMDYSDVSSIPKAAKQYVYYVTEKGIMSGMGGGEFSPNTDVLRGQIAVMLSKTAGISEYTFESATLTKINEQSKNLTFKDASGSEFKIGYTDKAKFFANGEEIKVSDLKEGQTVVMTYVSDENGTILAFADVIQKSVEAEEKKSVIFKDYVSVSNMLMVTIIEPDTEKTQTYVCDDNVTITSEGQEINLSAIKSGAYVTIGLANDKIVSIDAMQKNASIEGIIEKIGVLGTVTISSEKNPEFDGMTFSVPNDTLVIKNSDTASFAELGRGDKVQITLEYGVVKKIIATSLKKTITGVFMGYSMYDLAKITINRDGTTYEFDVPADAVITMNGESASISDLHQGSTVTVTVESEVVRKITADSTSGITDSKVTGRVVAANNGIINIVNSDNGSEVTITINCTQTARVYEIPKLNDYEKKNIKSGDYIEAYGSFVNGIFMATGILVTPKAE